MSKSVYSLILSDEVIAEIDRLAYRAGVSRSQMIDNLLAKEVAYTTPEMKIRQIFQSLEKGFAAMEQGMFLPLPSTGSTWGVRTALAYKYNPSLRYSVEFYRTPYENGAVGELRISLRSRSESLMAMMCDFFRLWQSLEKRIAPDVRYYLEDGKFKRSLIPDSEYSAEEFAEGIRSYVGLLNGAIGDYFNYPEDSGKLYAKLLAYYQKDPVKL